MRLVVEDFGLGGVVSPDDPVECLDGVEFVPVLGPDVDTLGHGGEGVAVDVEGLAVGLEADEGGGLHVVEHPQEVLLAESF